MADTRGYWGIDIGQAGLKAIRLRFEEGTDQIIADAFDYVPHPKILSQPDAIPEELIPQALGKFLERNDLKRDKIAISVPGHNALARFIQLPPVESSKISEIVKYEARQQIPFALEDVIWDYQKLGGGVEDSGFMLEAEVGLFAMKRELVMQQLNPFTEAGLEVELVQIAPLALYNYLSYDVLGIRPDDDVIAMDEYTIVLDMGADNTTLMVSNGEKIWIRNVPIGGNHFTRELTKEMKLTFAKAEHLKCNATKSPDPRAVFQALRPIFNNYVSEIQRSIGYFSSVNREAKISRVVGLGNGFKLAGMQKFLQQNLQYEVERVDSFSALTGDGVLNAPMFADNVLSFAVPYGLALQAMKQSRIHTTLLPPEIAITRKIREKKPWAVAGAALLLFCLATSVSGFSLVSRSTGSERWKDAEKKVSNLATHTATLKKEYSEQIKKINATTKKGVDLTRGLDTREMWLEIYKAINECLPRDVGEAKLETDISKKNRMFLNLVTFDKQDDLGEWFKGVSTAADRMKPSDKQNPPSGPGYVVVLEGVHYHHDTSDRSGQGPLYVIDTLLKNLKQWEIQREGSPPFPVGKLGISHARLADSDGPNPTEIPRNDSTFRGGGSARRNFRSRRGDDDDRSFRDATTPLVGAEGLVQSEMVSLNETVFTVEFVWTPIPEQKRLEKEPKPAETPAEGGN